MIKPLLHFYPGTNNEVKYAANKINRCHNNFLSSHSRTVTENDLSLIIKIKASNNIYFYFAVKFLFYTRKYEKV